MVHEKGLEIRLMRNSELSRKIVMVSEHFSENQKSNFLRTSGKQKIAFALFKEKY